MDFKVRCVDSGASNYFEDKKIYNVKNGRLISESGGDYTCGNKKFENVEEINDYCAKEGCGQEFELVEEEKMFTKDDLKVGYVVEERNKTILMVMEDESGKFISNGMGDWNPLDYYSDKMENEIFEKFDIVKVYGFSTNRSKAPNVTIENRPLLWERKEGPIEITIEEIAKLKGVSPDRIRIKE